MGRLIEKIQIIFGVTLCMLCSDISCQIDNESFNTFKSVIPQEKVVLHTNYNILLAGETLFYKVYSLNSLGRLSDVSKITYVELIGANKNNLFKHKLQLDKGLANGDFFIPPNIETGNYKLVAYTKWMNNNDANPFYQTDIYIINPFIPKDPFLENDETLDDNQIGLDVKNRATVINNENVNIKFETKKQTYKTRKKVELTLNNILRENNYGNYSLSVRKFDSLVLTNNQKTDNIVSKDHDENYLPELRGEVISGQVRYKSDNQIAVDEIIALSIPGSNYIYKNTKTDKTGKFYFSVHENYNNNDAIIQVLGKNKSVYNIIMDDKSFKYVNQLEYSEIKLKENAKKWLLKQSVYNQIESAYHNSKRDSVLNRKLAKAFYGKPTITYLLDDYKRFPTVKETFVEVIEEAAVRKNKGVFSFKVFNYEELRSNVFKDYEPLVLFDGNLIQNNLDVLDYACNKIESVSVVRGIYFNGPSIFNGIIDIKTKNGDFKLPKNREDLIFMDIEAIKNNKVYYNPDYNPDYDTKHKSLKRIPDYRTQLLWKPNLTLNSNSKPIHFYTSDVIGVFEVTLEGFSNNGNYIKSKAYFEVKN